MAEQHGDKTEQATPRRLEEAWKKGQFARSSEVMSPESRRLFTDALIFQHRPEVGRVIFMAAPLRGSDLANNWLARFASSLVKSPVALLAAGNDALKVIAHQPGDMGLKRIPNSVDTMSPNNRFVKAINTIPIAPGIPYHVICGDRGRHSRVSWLYT